LGVAVSAYMGVVTQKKSPNRRKRNVVAVSAYMGVVTSGEILKLISY